MAKYRAQILLEPEQHRALLALAEREGRSMSDLVREAVAEYVVDKTAEAEIQQSLDAIEQLATIRQKLEAEFGLFPADLIEQIREERAQEQARVLWGEVDDSH
jgi:predicted transcriptional regulator